MTRVRPLPAIAPRPTCEGDKHGGGVYRGVDGRIYVRVKGQADRVLEKCLWCGER